MSSTGTKVQKNTMLTMSPTARVPDHTKYPTSTYARYPAQPMVWQSQYNGFGFGTRTPPLLAIESSHFYRGVRVAKKHVELLEEPRGIVEHDEVARSV